MNVTASPKTPSYAWDNASSSSIIHPCTNIDLANDRGEAGRQMREYIRRRVLEITDHMLETRATVRQTARLFNVSKSTVHKDVTERLPSISKQLARKVKKILDQNKAERHIRGGEATRRKYRASGRA